MRGEPESVKVAARIGENYYMHIFHDSCTTLNLQFLQAVVPFLARNGIFNTQLPNGDVEPFSAIKSYQGNYLIAQFLLFSGESAITTSLRWKGRLQTYLEPSSAASVAQQ